MTKLLMKNTGKLGTGKTDLKRVEIYLTNEVYDVFDKLAKMDGRSTKKYMEVTLTTKAFNNAKKAN